MKKKSIDLNDKIKAISLQYCMWCKDHLSKRWSVEPSCKKCEVMKFLNDLSIYTNIVYDLSYLDKPEEFIVTEMDDCSILSSNKLYEIWLKAVNLTK